MILFLLEVYITIPLHSSRPYYHHDSANTWAGSGGGSSAEVGGAQPSHLTPPDPGVRKPDCGQRRKWAMDSGPGHPQAGKQYTQLSVGWPAILQRASFSFWWTTNCEINSTTNFCKLKMFFNYYYILSTTQEILTSEVSLATITFSSSHKKFCSQF